MTMSKPLAVFVAAAAVVGAAVVGTHQMRGKVVDPAQAISRRPSNVQSDLGAPHQNSGGHSGQLTNTAGTPTRLPADRDQRATDSDGPNSAGGTKTRANGHRQDRAKNGSYAAVIAGFYTGTGTADVRDDKVSIKAEVRGSDGRSGQFIATNLMFDGPYFYGSGTVMDEPVQVNGRVDAARASRLTATFIAANGHDGRVVGKLPATLDAGDDDWDGDDVHTRQPR